MYSGNVLHVSVRKHNIFTCNCAYNTDWYVCCIFEVLQIRFWSFQKHQGQLYFGPTCIGNTSTASFSVTNTSRLAVCFSWRVVGSGASILEVDSASGTLLPNEIQVTVSPHGWSLLWRILYFVIYYILYLLIIIMIIPHIRLMSGNLHRGRIGGIHWRLSSRSQWIQHYCRAVLCQRRSSLFWTFLARGALERLR